MEKKKTSGYVATLIGGGSKEPDADDRGGPPDFDPDDVPPTGHEMAYESLVGAVGDKQASAIRDYVKACVNGGSSYGEG